MKQLNNKGWLKAGRLYIYASVLFAFVMGIITIVYPKGSLILWFAGQRNEFWNTFFLFGTRLGEEHIFVITIIVLVFFSYRKSALFSVAGVMTMVSSFIAKSIFSQPRPLRYFSDLGEAQQLGSIKNYDFHIGLTSMPSGHTMAAFCFFFLLAILSKKPLFKVIAFILAVIVGVSRIYLGQHFSADVAVGSIFGILVGILSYYLVFVVWEDKEKLDRSFLSKN